VKKIIERIVVIYCKYCAHFDFLS